MSHISKTGKREIGAFCQCIRGYRDHVWSKMALIVGIFERDDARDDKMVKISRNEGI